MLTRPTLVLAPNWLDQFTPMYTADDQTAVVDLAWLDAVDAIASIIDSESPREQSVIKISYERCTFGDCSGMSKKRRSVCHEDVALARESLGDQSSLLIVENNRIQLCRTHTKELFPRLKCIEHGCSNLVACVNVHKSTLADGKMYKCYKHARVLCTAVAPKSTHVDGQRIASKRVRRCKRVAAHLLDTPSRALCKQCASAYMSC